MVSGSAASGYLLRKRMNPVTYFSSVGLSPGTRPRLAGMMQSELGSVRVPRAADGVAPLAGKPFCAALIGLGKVGIEVFGGTPNTTRRRRVLPILGGIVKALREGRLWNSHDLAAGKPPEPAHWEVGATGGAALFSDYRRACAEFSVLFFAPFAARVRPWKSSLA
ncbi:MAG: hypothetical protein JWQ04_1550 [Pedosphaera sp.]|nr:hypothetical protein [Pedosphaera sp.]